MASTARGAGAEGARPGGGRTPPWTRNDVLVTAGAAVVDLFGFTLNSQLDLGYIPMAGCLLSALATLPLLVRRRFPLSTLVTVLLLGLALDLTVPMPPHFSLSLGLSLYTVARHRSPRVTAASVLACVVLPMASRVSESEPPVLYLVSTGVAGIVVVVAATVMSHWQRDIETNRRLMADRAVAAERRRIARELHDIVAHHITTMQLMSGGARANLARDPEVAREALITLEGAGRMALREMRQLLDVLRAGDEAEEEPTEPQPGEGDLERIVAASRRAGLPTGLEVRGEPRPLPPSVGLAVFRIVQEALTNTRKHAGGATASVVLCYEPDGVAVTVTDDGTGGEGGAGAAAADGSGYGLVGMRERAVLLGGTLTAGPQDTGGYRVAARLPLTADEGALR
ncbi:histidine kinase [Streptomyces sp. SID8352]|uniref:sensor histidine kinase n=1 Tax=Streptomyces sp. SID8352 TaxID=2690338 RepID=UPI001368CE45|nr:histidine kinase [Streptomyces sp. SID8352]MYU22963.1 histidine kinase [Streptomyces sp. SID8352]